MDQADHTARVDAILADMSDGDISDDTAEIAVRALDLAAHGGADAGLVSDAALHAWADAGEDTPAGSVPRPVLPSPPTSASGRRASAAQASVSVLKYASNGLGARVLAAAGAAPAAHAQARTWSALAWTNAEEQAVAASAASAQPEVTVLDAASARLTQRGVPMLPEAATAALARARAHSDDASSVDSRAASLEEPSASTQPLPQLSDGLNLADEQAADDDEAQALLRPVGVEVMQGVSRAVQLGQRDAAHGQPTSMASSMRSYLLGTSNGSLLVYNRFQDFQHQLMPPPGSSCSGAVTCVAVLSTKVVANAGNYTELAVVGMASGGVIVYDLNKRIIAKEIPPGELPAPAGSSSGRRVTHVLPVSGSLPSTAPGVPGALLSAAKGVRAEVEANEDVPKFAVVSSGGMVHMVTLSYNNFLRRWSMASSIMLNGSQLGSILACSCLRPAVPQQVALAIASKGQDQVASSAEDAPTTIPANHLASLCALGALMAFSGERGTYIIVTAPQPNIVYFWPRPPCARAGTTPFTAWAWAKVRGSRTDASIAHAASSQQCTAAPPLMPESSTSLGVLTADTSPTLVRCWDNVVQFLQVQPAGGFAAASTTQLPVAPSTGAGDAGNVPALLRQLFGLKPLTFVESDVIRAARPVAGAAWLTAHELLVVGGAGTLQLIDSSELRELVALPLAAPLVQQPLRPAGTSNQKAVDLPPTASRVLHDDRHVVEPGFHVGHSLVHSEDGILHLLTVNSVLEVKGLPWDIRAQRLLQAGQFYPALALARAAHQRIAAATRQKAAALRQRLQVSVNSQKPSARPAAQQAMEKRLRLLASQAVPGHAAAALKGIGMRYLRVMLPPATALPSSDESTSQHVETVATVAVEYFTTIGAPLSVLEELHSVFSEAHERGSAAFIEALIPAVLSRRVTELTPVLLQALITHCKDTGQLQAVERCVQFLDPAGMDVNAVVRLCLRTRLFWGLAHVYLRALTDIASPVDVLLAAAMPAHALSAVVPPDIDGPPPGTALAMLARQRAAAAAEDGASAGSDSDGAPAAPGSDTAPLLPPTHNTAAGAIALLILQRCLVGDTPLAGQHLLEPPASARTVFADTALSVLLDERPSKFPDVSFTMLPALPLIDPTTQQYQLATSEAAHHGVVAAQKLPGPYPRLQALVLRDAVGVGELIDSLGAAACAEAGRSLQHALETWMLRVQRGGVASSGNAVHHASISQAFLPGLHSTADSMVRLENAAALELPVFVHKHVPLAAIPVHNSWREQLQSAMSACQESAPVQRVLAVLEAFTDAVLPTVTSPCAAARRQLASAAHDKQLFTPDHVVPMLEAVAAMLLSLPAPTIFPSAEYASAASLSPVALLQPALSPAACMLPVPPLLLQFVFEYLLVAARNWALTKKPTPGKAAGGGSQPALAPNPYAAAFSCLLPRCPPSLALAQELLGVAQELQVWEAVIVTARYLGDIPRLLDAYLAVPNAQVKRHAFLAIRDEALVCYSQIALEATRALQLEASAEQAATPTEAPRKPSARSAAVLSSDDESDIDSGSDSDSSAEPPAPRSRLAQVDTRAPFNPACSGHVRLAYLQAKVMAMFASLTSLDAEGAARVVVEMFPAEAERVLKMLNDYGDLQFKFLRSLMSHADGGVGGPVGSLASPGAAPASSPRPGPVGGPVPTGDTGLGGVLCVGGDILPAPPGGASLAAGAAPAALLKPHQAQGAMDAPCTVLLPESICSMVMRYGEVRSEVALRLVDEHGVHEKASTLTKVLHAAMAQLAASGDLPATVGASVHRPERWGLRPIRQLVRGSALGTTQQIMMMYLRRLCEAQPRAVASFLAAQGEELPTEAALEHVTRRQVWDAAATLAEKQGQLEEALKYSLAHFDGQLEQAAAALQHAAPAVAAVLAGMDSEGAGDGAAAKTTPDVEAAQRTAATATLLDVQQQDALAAGLMRAPEPAGALAAARQAGDLMSRFCERHTDRELAVRALEDATATSSGSGHASEESGLGVAGEGLWFRVLGWLVQRQQEKQAELDELLPRLMAWREDMQDRELEHAVTFASKAVALRAQLRLLLQLVAQFMQGMQRVLPLTLALKRLLEQTSRLQFGGLRDSMMAILAGFETERNLLDAAKLVVERSANTAALASLTARRAAVYTAAPFHTAAAIQAWKCGGVRARLHAGQAARRQVASLGTDALLAAPPSTSVARRRALADLQAEEQLLVVLGTGVAVAQQDVDQLSAMVQMLRAAHGGQPGSSAGSAAAGSGGASGLPSDAQVSSSVVVTHNEVRGVGSRLCPQRAPVGAARSAAWGAEGSDLAASRKRRASTAGNDDEQGLLQLEADLPEWGKQSLAHDRLAARERPLHEILQELSSASANVGSMRLQTAPSSQTTMWRLGGPSSRAARAAEVQAPARPVFTASLA